MGEMSGAIRSQAEEAQADRLGRISKAWVAYNSQLKGPLKKTKDGYDDNVPMSFAPLIVDTSVSFLFGEEITWARKNVVEATETSQDAADELIDFLDAVWGANRKKTLLTKIGINGGVAGHSWLKIIPEGVALPDGTLVPRLVNLDPSNVEAIWSADDYEDVIQYRITYSTIDPATGNGEVRQERITRSDVTNSETPYLEEDAVRDPSTIRWVITKWKAKDEGGMSGSGTVDEWVSLGEETSWDFSFPPIIGCQNLPSPNEYYGTSDLEPNIIDTCAALVFNLSNINRIIRIFAHPRTIVTGLQPEQFKQITISPDHMVGLPDPEAKMFNLEMQSDLSSSLEYFRELKEALHATTRIPEIATGKLASTGQLSGLALSILYAPLIQKTMTKRDLYGEMLVELCHRILVLTGKNVTDLQLDIQWSEPIPGSNLIEREIAKADKELGVSIRTLLKKLGYDPDTEEMNREQEQTAAANVTATSFDRGNGTTPPVPTPTLSPQDQQSSQVESGQAPSA